MMRGMPADYQGKRVTVMGLGRFGGGVGVTQFLSSRGALVTVTDTASEDQLADSVAQVKDLSNVSLVLGEHREEHFRPTHADLVVANPAVKPTNKYLKIAKDAGVPVTTEIVLLVRELPNRLRTIGVTGSAGKSTTTAMIAHILRKAFGQEGETPDASREQPGVWMGGNIGGSLLPVVDQIRDDDWVVLELSSFMLHYLREEKWSPHIAVVTNISPNHLDWHGDYSSYVAAKAAIFDHQVAEDRFVMPPDLRSTFKTKTKIGWGGGTVQDVAGRRLPVDEVLLVPGEHNLSNAMAAVHAVALGAWNGAAAMELVRDFAGLPHRLEFVGSCPAADSASSSTGIRFINDSKSTTPEAAILGIEAFDPGTVNVILGGYDKGSDLSALCGVAAERCVGVYTIGATGDAIADGVDRLKRAGPCRPGRETGDAADAARAEHTGPTRPGSLEVVRCGTLETAVYEIKQRVQPGEVVLLSPGCASWDQFENYEQRGERFIELVRGLG